MKNTVNNFGYLEEVDIKSKLIFPPSLRGCNKEELTELFKLDFVPDDILKLIPKVPLEKLQSGIKSFTYQKLTSCNNEVIDKYAYLFLIMNDLGTQIQKLLDIKKICIVNFDNYVNDDYQSNETLIEFLEQILRFRGYYTELMDNEILAINCNYRVTAEQVDRVLQNNKRENITIYVEDRLENKEELIYRSVSELLNINTRYMNLNVKWLECKNNLKELSKLSFDELHKLAYDIFHMYACLNSYKDIDGSELNKDTEENVERLINCLELDKHKEILQLATDTYDSTCVIGLDEVMYAKEYSVAREIIEESLELAENIIDQYYTPDMKLVRCTRLFEKDLQLFSYELLHTTVAPSSPLAIPKPIKHTKIEDITEKQEVDYEGSENIVYTNNKRAKGFKRYLPIIALTVIALLAARLITM